LKNEVVFSLNRQVDHQLQAATDPFELDRGASPNYTAAPWTDPRPYPDSVRAHAIYAERSPARALTRIRPSQL